jgi:hypothetical protein
MSWSDLPPKRRAVIRGSVFLVVMLIVSVIWNVADDSTTAIFRIQDVLLVVMVTGAYVALMYLVETRLAKRGAR